MQDFDSIFFPPDPCERGLLPAWVADQASDAAGVVGRPASGRVDGPVPGLRRPARSGRLARPAVDRRSRQALGDGEDSGQGKATQGEDTLPY